MHVLSVIDSGVLISDELMTPHRLYVNSRYVEIIIRTIISL